MWRLCLLVALGLSSCRAPEIGESTASLVPSYGDGLGTHNCTFALAANAFLQTTGYSFCSETAAAPYTVGGITYDRWYNEIGGLWAGAPLLVNCPGLPEQKRGCQNNFRVCLRLGGLPAKGVLSEFGNLTGDGGCAVGPRRPYKCNSNPDVVCCATPEDCPIHALTVTHTPLSLGASGIVSSSIAGIHADRPGTVQASYSAQAKDGALQGDARVVLTATPTPGSASVFAGWSGDCTGTSTCRLGMDLADRDVTATFECSGPETSLTITLVDPPDGSEVVATPGLSCAAGSCVARVCAGGIVNLELGGAADVWTGFTGAGCTGAGTTCDVTMASDQEVTATWGRMGVFEVDSSPPRVLETSNFIGPECPSRIRIVMAAAQTYTWKAPGGACAETATEDDGRIFECRSPSCPESRFLATIDPTGAKHAFVFHAQKGTHVEEARDTSSPPTAASPPAARPR